MPNSPASTPVTTPLNRMAAASQASSSADAPRNMPISADAGSPEGPSGCGGLGEVDVGVDHERQRLRQDFRAGAGSDRVLGDVAAERARARHAMEQAEHVPSDRMQAM